MSQFQTVTLELLRHGPPHNQLLSPLTQYLGLCGNHPAVTVAIPLEHSQLLVRLKALMYEGVSDDARDLLLQETAQMMGGILGQVPGLIAELAEVRGEPPVQAHLRLVLSASELALLPFELALAPNGCPGAGQSLALQSVAPVCITREVRRIGRRGRPWTRTPKILFAAASPADAGQVPLEEHLLALRRVINPWLDRERPRKGKPGQRGRVEAGEEVAEAGSLARRLQKHLIVLPQASVGSIRRACAENEFTHVHILAHGHLLPGTDEKHYGLALHSDEDPSRKDVVDGTRLATVLRTYRSGDEAGLSLPDVVTLAACQGGAQGSVVGAGASIAHALHAGGIPLVVASQFPLSFLASVMMVEVLYEDLLWGRDPRRVVNDLRWQLRSRLPETHDWASLVSYADLPEGLESQLLKYRLEQVRRSSVTAATFVDHLSEAHAPPSGPGTGEPAPAKARSAAPHSARTRAAAAQPTGPASGNGDGREQLERLVAGVQDARKVFAEVRPRLRRLLKDIPPSNGEDRAVVYGRLGSIDKREGQCLVLLRERARHADEERTPGPAPRKREAQRYFQQARENYQRAFLADPREVWSLVQRLSLDALLGGRSKVESQDWRDSWVTARVLSEERLLLANPKWRILGAHADMAELYLLSGLCPDLVRPQESARSEALRHVKELARNDQGRQYHAMHHQMDRYANCYPHLNPLFKIVAVLAREILGLLPELDFGQPPAAAGSSEMRVVSSSVAGEK